MSTGRSVLIPLSLFVVAVMARLLTISAVPFPPTEGSLYYLDVARNLVTGQGLTTDVLWSYASPPLTLPRPAFDLWLPLASLVAAVPMLVAGTGHHAGQFGGVLLGALIAPLTWAVAREAARVNGLDERRRAAAAIASGLLAAVLGPWLVATAAPDSTVPFTILATTSALLMSRMLLRRAPADTVEGGPRGGTDPRRDELARRTRAGHHPGTDLPRPPGGHLAGPDTPRAVPWRPPPRATRRTPARRLRACWGRWSSVA